MSIVDPNRGEAGTGILLNLQRMSTEDGPGIRTTVFFKGCSLSCQWCHNPESISAKPEVVWNGIHCIRCGTCSALCPRDAVEVKAEGVTVDRSRCDLCGICTEQCPTLAMELLGKTWTLPDLVAELVKDRAYFERSGGGVTLSGGEPAFQAAFARAVLERCRSLGLHTALDTCGMCSPSVLEGLLENTDLLLYDLKLIDPERHLQLTGAPNRVILDNLRMAGERIRTSHPAIRLWIRTPLIPEATAFDQNISDITAFLLGHLDDLVERWELCAFNNLCRSKYERLGVPWRFASTALPTALELDHFRETAVRSGMDPARVSVTGLARLERARNEQVGSSRREVSPGEPMTEDAP